MKNIILFLAFSLLNISFGHAQDEADIPPPPMPEYMKKHQANNPAPTPAPQERQMASESQAFDDQTSESIKNEFLNAGEEDSEVNDARAVQEVEEGPIQEEEPLEVVQKPSIVLEDIPGPERLQEVSEVEVATPEFEQAEIPVTEDIKRNYQQGAGNELKEEVTAGGSNSENLEEVEENLEAAGEVAQQTLESSRKPSGKKAFKAGMHKFSKKCSMQAEPSSMSDEAGVIRPGRKLWIDAHNDDWHKAYKKSGTVYISADCLQ